MSRWERMLQQFFGVFFFNFILQKDSGGNENKIFVGGLGGNTTEEELKRFFSVFGKVQFFKHFTSDL